ncbi:unnamed protein product, partial [Didymodactylos carnosus]
MSTGVSDNDNTVSKLSSMLIDNTLPMKLRFRILFTLKTLNGKHAIDAINLAFNDTSALLKHECAYCLGQMANQYAIPYLLRVLNDEKEDSMVRHEAGEALGAIGCYDNKDVLNALEANSQSNYPEIAETCQIALDRLKWLHENNICDSNNKKPYSTIDPAPAFDITDISDLRTILLDEKKSLFERYRALFALRDLGSDNDNAVLAICD